MSRVVSHISISLDGRVAGPGQSREEGLGRGGEALHEWLFDSDDPIDREIAAHVFDGVGAHVMGRGMFGPPDGPDPRWRGWWGEEPPYHTPVFVLTHHAREPLTLADTTFHFVTEGVEVALERAREAAGAGDVFISGGASTIDQTARAGALDELHVHVAPLVLGDGPRLFADVGDARFEQLEVRQGGKAAHVRYRVTR